MVRYIGFQRWHTIFNHIAFQSVATHISYWWKRKNRCFFFWLGKIQYFSRISNFYYDVKVIWPYDIVLWCMTLCTATYPNQEHKFTIEMDRFELINNGDLMNNSPGITFRSHSFSITVCLSLYAFLCFRSPVGICLSVNWFVCVCGFISKLSLYCQKRKEKYQQQQQHQQWTAASEKKFSVHISIFSHQITHTREKYILVRQKAINENGFMINLLCRVCAIFHKCRTDKNHLTRCISENKRKIIKQMEFHSQPLFSMLGRKPDR